jgi:hypothetical protein
MKAARVHPAFAVPAQPSTKPALLLQQTLGRFVLLRLTLPETDDCRYHEGMAANWPCPGLSLVYGDLASKNSLSPNPQPMHLCRQAQASYAAALRASAGWTYVERASAGWTSAGYHKRELKLVCAAQKWHGLCDV